MTECSLKRGLVPLHVTSNATQCAWILRSWRMTSLRRLGLPHDGGVPPGTPGYDADTVFLTVPALDASGTIIFSDQTDNCRLWPEPETALGAPRYAAT